MRTKLTGLALAVTFVWAAAAPASAADRPSKADRAFETMLHDFEAVPTRDLLLKAWPDARERLLRAATNERRLEWPRSRAISMLSMFPDAEVRQTLETLAAHRLTFVRRMAVYWVARTFGEPGDAELVAHVAKAAGDSAPEVRDRAVRALRWVAHPAAGEALQKIAADHPDARLRGLALRTLKKRNR